MTKKRKDMPVDELQDTREDTNQDTLESPDNTDHPDGEIVAELQTAKADIEKEKEKFLRLFAEFENYKKRTSRERMELFKTAGQEVLLSLLPVLDDFDRALSEMEKAENKELLTGINLIHSKLKETLRLKGLEAMKVKKGDSFDPELHEAITQIPAPTKKLKGKVIDIIEKGYTLNDKIIRHPKVVVGQ